MIQFNQTEIGYKQTLLKIDSLDLQEGKVYALVGRNGVGKSTLLQSMAKLLPLITGDIRYEDISLKNFKQYIFFNTFLTYFLTNLDRRGYFRVRKLRL